MHKGLKGIVVMGLLVSLFGCAKPNDGDGMVRTPEMIAQDEVAKLLADTYNESVRSEEGQAMMALMDEKGDTYIILDVRTEEEFAEGHIPKAINVANEVIDESITTLIEVDTPVFVYCRSGNRSKQAQAKLVKLGYTKIVEFEGVQQWKGEIVK